MVNITPFLIAVICIIAGVWSVIAVPWFRENRAQIKDERIATAVDEAVRWAEQIFKDYTGPEKRRKVLDYMQAWLNARGYEYDEDQLSIYLEASVFDIVGGIEVPIPVAVSTIEDDVK